MRRITAAVCIATLGILGLPSRDARGEGSPIPGLAEVDLSTSWCGAKGLWLIARAYVRPYSLDQIKDFCDPSRSSSGNLSLVDLARAAEKVGLTASPVQCKLDWLIGTRLPSLTLHRAKSRGLNRQDFLHFLVLVGRSGDTLQVIDPFSPDRVEKYSTERFQKTWTGYTLIVARSRD